MSQNILITGGTGLVGTRLTEILLDKGYNVSHLSRSPKDKQQVQVYTWDIGKHEMDPKAVAEADYIVHLAGAGVADKRWSQSRKKAILNSRVQSTRLLHDTISQLGSHHIKGFISASAVGIYGIDTGAVVMEEDSPQGDDFLAEVTKSWEAEADQLAQLNIKVTKIRTGVALSMHGGALPQMAMPVKMGVGSPLGDGQQYMSWIHIDDLCYMYVYAIENNSQGIFNGVGPAPVTNAEFTKTLATIMNRPMFFPNVPAFAIKLLFGEMASVVLGGSNVSSDKIEKAGFQFRFNNLKTALLDLVK